MEPAVSVSLPSTPPARGPRLRTVGKTERSHCPVHPHGSLARSICGEDYVWGFEGSFDYARCTDCGTLVLDPRPVQEEIGRYYGRYYEPAIVTAYRKAYREVRAELAGIADLLRALSCMDDQDSTGDPLRPGDRVLDVGCGPGGVLRFLRQQAGVEVRGVDFDPVCRELARDVHQVQVDSGELADQRYPSGSFDLLTSYHCLEHVYDPPAQLREMARLVRPGGWIHVEVPTPGLLARIFRGRWVYLQPPTHLYHYTPEGLRTLVEEAGFEPVRVLRPWFPGELAGSLFALFGVRQIIPLVVLPATTLRHVLLQCLSVLLFLAADLPVATILALLGQGGVLRIIARRKG